jgi:1,4-dihydroxy-2-naphthoate octaprenyltransferase
MVTSIYIPGSSLEDFMFREFIALIRPRTLAAAFSPVLLGAAFSYFAGLFPFDGLGWSIIYSILIFLAVVSAQMVANMWNEYCDYKSGLDHGQKAGNAGSIVKGHMSPSLVLTFLKVTMVIPIIIGLFLSWKITWAYLPVGLLCILVSFLYSGGPLPISRTPLGEVASGLTMGCAIVLITAFAWLRDIPAALIIPALPSTLWVGMIMFVNNIRDINNDRKHGRKTLAILLGKDKALSLLGMLVWFNPIWIATWIYSGVLPLYTSLVFIAVIPGLQAVKILGRYADAVHADKAMGKIASSTILYHVILALTLILGKLLK